MKPNGRTEGLGSRTRYFLTEAAVEEWRVVVRAPEVKSPKEESTEGGKEEEEVSFDAPSSFSRFKALESEPVTHQQA